MRNALVTDQQRQKCLLDILDKWHEMQLNGERVTWQQVLDRLQGEYQYELPAYPTIWRWLHKEPWGIEAYKAWKTSTKGAADLMVSSRFLEALEGQLKIACNEGGQHSDKAQTDAWHKLQPYFVEAGMLNSQVLNPGQGGASILIQNFVGQVTQARERKRADRETIEGECTPIAE